MVRLQVDEPEVIGLCVDESEIVELGFEEKIVIVDPGQMDVYDGPYVVDPDFDGQVLDTNNKMMTDDVTVNPILVARTSNPSGGTTVYIGGII